MRGNVVGSRYDLLKFGGSLIRPRLTALAKASDSFRVACPCVAVFDGIGKSFGRSAAFYAVAMGRADKTYFPLRYMLNLLLF